MHNTRQFWGCLVPALLAAPESGKEWWQSKTWLKLSALSAKLETHTLCWSIPSTIIRSCFPCWFKTLFLNANSCVGDSAQWWAMTCMDVGRCPWLRGPLHQLYSIINRLQLAASTGQVIGDSHPWSLYCSWGSDMAHGNMVILWLPHVASGTVV